MIRPQVAPVYSVHIPNSPQLYVRALPGMWPPNFIGANPGQAGANMPRTINLLDALASYQPT